MGGVYVDQCSRSLSPDIRLIRVFAEAGFQFLNDSVVPYVTRYMQP